MEENAHFCHKCGTPVVTFTPVPPIPPAKPAQKKRFSTEVIVLISVVAIAAIVLIIVFALLFSANFNQANNNANGGNTMNLIFKVQGDPTKVCALNQNLIQKTSVAYSGTNILNANFNLNVRRNSFV